MHSSHLVSLKSVDDDEYVDDEYEEYEAMEKGEG